MLTLDLHRTVQCTFTFILIFFVTKGPHQNYFTNVREHHETLGKISEIVQG